MPAPRATTRACDRKAARRADGALIAKAELGERRASGDAELRLDEVDARHLLGDGVLHLDARVALDEEVLAGLGRDEELDGPGVDVVRGARQLDRVREDLLSQRFVEPRRRRHLDDLLVAELHRAVALVEVDHVAVRVGEDLHLDVSRPSDEPLDEHRAVAEGRLRLALAAGEGLGHRRRILHGAHAAPAAACRRLEHDGVAELARQLQRFARGLQGLTASGHDGDAERPCERACADLVAEQGEHRRRRTDENETLGRAQLGECSVLGQESVARVDAIATARFRDPDECPGVEVRSHGVSGAASLPCDLTRFGGEPGVQRERIDRRVHAYGFHTERGGSLGNAYGDLAAVTYQDAFQQCQFSRRRTLNERGLVVQPARP